MISIKGWQKTSLIDYPGKACSVVFLPDCNFRCPYCQNPDLIRKPEKIPDIPEHEILDYARIHRKWIDGICITGGEPCLSKDLTEFIVKVKRLGFLAKLDTNGSNPKLLGKLIDERLLDYVSMDIKAPPEKYEQVARVKVNLKAIKDSIEIIRDSGIDYEFRTTFAPKLLSGEDIIKIAEWLKGSKRYVLQQFRPKITLDKSFQKEKPYPEKKLQELAEKLKPYFWKVEVRA